MKVTLFTGGIEASEGFGGAVASVQRALLGGGDKAALLAVVMACLPYVADVRRFPKVERVLKTEVHKGCQVSAVSVF